jgi:hypothetical protein
MKLGRWAAAAAVSAAVLAGCDAGSGRIPLAKVPPPPEGFGSVKPSPKAPKAGSAQNAQDLYK